MKSQRIPLAPREDGYGAPQAPTKLEWVNAIRYILSRSERTTLKSQSILSRSERTTLKSHRRPLAPREEGYGAPQAPTKLEWVNAIRYILSRSERSTMKSKRRRTQQPITNTQPFIGFRRQPADEAVEFRRVEIVQGLIQAGGIPDRIRRQKNLFQRT